MNVPEPRTHEDVDAPEVAAEELDLALARLSWAESCTCERTTEQSAALRWHAAQVSDARSRAGEGNVQAGRGGRTVLP